MIYHPFRNLGLKALSVGIATLLWLTVAGEQVVERSLGVPLELINTPANLEVVEQPPETVVARVRGSSSVLSQIDQGAVAAVLNVETARAKRQYFHLTPADVRAPYGVEVLQVSPGTVVLRFEQTVTKVIKVRVPLEGTPAAGFVIASTSVVPDSVTIDGPTSAVEAIVEAVTETVNVQSARERMVETVTIRVNDPLVRLRTPQTARVTIDIQPAPVTRILTGVRVSPRDSSSGTAPTMVPAAVTVEVRGQSSVVDALTSSALTAVADVAGLGPGEHYRPVQVEPPPGVEVVGVTPARVRIRIR